MPDFPQCSVQFRKSASISCSFHDIKMMLEQPPKPPQFPDGLVVRSGDNGPAAEEKPPHILGNRDSGGDGLPGYSFIFFGGKSERPPPMKSGCGLPFFHLPFLPF